MCMFNPLRAVVEEMVVVEKRCSAPETDSSPVIGIGNNNCGNNPDNNSHSNFVRRRYGI